MGTTMTELPMLARELCCGPDGCQYSLDRIRYLQFLRGKFRGEDLHEAASSCFDPHQGYEMGRTDAFGPTWEARWALFIGEVEAAERAGCQTPEEICRYLCPFALADDEEIR